MLLWLACRSFVEFRSPFARFASAHQTLLWLVFRRNGPLRMCGRLRCRCSRTLRHFLNVAPVRILRAFTKVRIAPGALAAPFCCSPPHGARFLQVMLPIFSLLLRRIAVKTMVPSMTLTPLIFALGMLLRLRCGKGPVRNRCSHAAWRSFWESALSPPPLPHCCCGVDAVA